MNDAHDVVAQRLSGLQVVIEHVSVRTDLRGRRKPRPSGVWGGRRDSNSQPPTRKVVALPIELRPPWIPAGRFPRAINQGGIAPFVFLARLLLHLVGRRDTADQLQLRICANPHIFIAVSIRPLLVHQGAVDFYGASGERPVEYWSQEFRKIVREENDASNRTVLDRIEEVRTDLRSRIGHQR
jgi:hypothetical protein